MSFFNNIKETFALSPKFKRMKIIAILKLGNDSKIHENYCPIPLLICCYELLCLIYNTIYTAIDAVIPVEQVGFRNRHNSSEQEFSVTTNIEAVSRNRKRNTDLTFIDLTAAFVTVCRDCSIYKLMKVIKCSSSWGIQKRHMQPVKMLNDGLPQGLVFVPNYLKSTQPTYLSQRHLPIPMIRISLFKVKLEKKGRTIWMKNVEYYETIPKAGDLALIPETSVLLVLVRLFSIYLICLRTITSVLLSTAKLSNLIKMRSTYV